MVNHAGLSQRSGELIDMTSFQQVFGAFNGTIGNNIDGICQLGGNLFVWMKGIGLGVLSDQGFKCMSEEIYAGNPANLDCNCIVAADERAKLIFVKKVGETTTMVYNYRDHNWHKWNINVTGKGFGNAGGMFSVAGTLSPARVGALCTSASEDTSIVPTVYTPALNFDSPLREKFITDLYIDRPG